MEFLILICFLIGTTNAISNATYTRVFNQYFDLIDDNKDGDVTLDELTKNAELLSMSLGLSEAEHREKYHFPMELSKAYFSKADLDGDGIFTLKDLKKMRVLGDTDFDGHLDREEYVSYALKLNMEVEQIVKRSAFDFYVLDRTRDGFLDQEELAKGFVLLSDVLKFKTSDEFIGSAMTFSGADKRLNYEEFTSFYKDILGS